jgi:hypothetical protein
MHSKEAESNKVFACKYQDQCYEGHTGVFTIM